MKHTSKRTLIPEDFEVSDEIITLAKKNGWPDPYSEAEGFRDYHIAHGTLMFDWEAAFRTWLRNCLKFNKVAPTLPVSQVPRHTASNRMELTREQRAENQRKLRELMSGIGKKI